jgi:hypothetical protein
MIWTTFWNRYFQLEFLFLAQKIKWWRIHLLTVRILPEYFFINLIDYILKLWQREDWGKCAVKK